MAAAATSSTTATGRSLWTALRALFVLTVILGVAYPLALVGVGLLMPNQAGGSPLRDQHGVVRGSSILAQPVDGPGWFHPRPSAAGDGWDPMSSGASNESPASKDYQEEIAKVRQEVADREGVSPDQVPADAFTSSGSGLDPHISTAYANIQAKRVAKETKLGEQKVEELIKKNTDQDFAGMSTGAPVNVVRLNADIAAAEGK